MKHDNKKIDEIINDLEIEETKNPDVTAYRDQLVEFAMKKYAEHIRKQTVEECRPNKEDFADERNYNTALNFYRHVLLPRLSALNELE